MLAAMLLYALELPRLFARMRSAMSCAAMTATLRRFAVRLFCRAPACRPARPSSPTEKINSAIMASSMVKPWLCEMRFVQCLEFMGM
jgi:hypothetical protein